MRSFVYTTAAVGRSRKSSTKKHLQTSRPLPSGGKNDFRSRHRLHFVVHHFSPSLALQVLNRRRHVTTRRERRAQHTQRNFSHYRSLPPIGTASNKSFLDIFFLYPHNQLCLPPKEVCLAGEREERKKATSDRKGDTKSQESRLQIICQATETTKGEK